ncbi:unnamed protein product [Didymodactylos carnosus]|uniref:Uncharacterized protein n=1 Tax=Didymodactylos carnosus TaxID=1234261 RepID=A0A814ZSY3_9BILA|nr:unnamed protein product [Didymodactylos carnosus]CAF4012600.1 unnamed protein product [Didymodactylos carnosus]
MNSTAYGPFLFLIIIISICSLSNAWSSYDKRKRRDDSETCLEEYRELRVRSSQDYLNDFVDDSDEDDDSDQANFISKKSNYSNPSDDVSHSLEPINNDSGQEDDDDDENDPMVRESVCEAAMDNYGSIIGAPYRWRRRRSSSSPLPINAYSLAKYCPGGQEIKEMSEENENNCDIKKRQLIKKRHVRRSFRRAIRGVKRHDVKRHLLKKKEISKRKALRFMKKRFFSR